MINQMVEFKSGTRSSSVPGRPPGFMAKIAASASAADIEAAAAYFSTQRPVSFIRVVETDTVPRTEVKGWVLAKAKTGGTEPLGNRIVETPDDAERFELRDGRVTFTAYVPMGSIAMGEGLVKSGAEGGPACISCHGANLRGVGSIPSLAGRSPSYIARQLYDFHSGARHGANAAIMKPVADRLNDADRIAIAAYLATRTP